MNTFSIKTCLLLALLMTVANELMSQAVGINTESIPEHTILRVYSDPSVKPGGILSPQLSTNERNLINYTEALDGLYIYNTTVGRYEMLKNGNWVGLDGGLWSPGANGSTYHDSGFVGIQTQTPAYPLHVAGNDPIVLMVQRLATSTGQAQIMMRNDEKGVYIGLQPSGSFIAAGLNVPGTMLEIEPSKPGDLSVNNQPGGIVPKGGIIMWSGAPDNIPTGWALCNGETVNGTMTPNLSGKFVVGYSPNEPDYNAVGKTGGANSVELNLNQLPPHSHTFSGTTSEDGAHSHNTSIGENCCSADGGYYLWKGGYAGLKTFQSSVAGNHTHTFSGTTSSVGGGEKHENRPPYYVLAYIIKL